MANWIAGSSTGFETVDANDIVNGPERSCGREVGMDNATVACWPAVSAEGAKVNVGAETCCIGRVPVAVLFEGIKSSGVETAVTVCVTDVAVALRLTATVIGIEALEFGRNGEPE